jgi:hypothetical protein
VTEEEEGSMDNELTVDERITYGTDAHANDPDEHPLNHVGSVIEDPWDDPEQDDWVTAHLNMDDD